MKVILTSKIRNLGNVGDIVTVKDGYGRNHLIPKGMAIVYSDANYKVFEAQKQKFEEENKKRQEVAEVFKNKLEGKYVVLVESASEDGKLYGSVSTSKLSTEINRILGKDSVAKNQIIIRNPIKNIGDYSVTLALHPEVIFDVTVVVAVSDDEAKAMIKELKNPKKAEKKEEKPAKEKVEKTEEKEEK